MKTKRSNKSVAVKSDAAEVEYTLESWKRDCEEMEAEMAKESAELRETLDNVRNDEELDPEIKKYMLEVGEKMLDSDGFLKELNKFTTGVIARCDEVIARCNAIDSGKKKSAREVKKGKKKGGEK